MGLIATRDKRDKLRLFYEDTKQGASSGKPLKKVLMEALRACDQVAPNGTWLASSNEAGGGSALAILQGMTPLDARRLCGELLDLFDRVVPYLGVPDDGSADDQIFTQMLGVTSTTGPRLRRVSAIKQDFTGIRYGYGAPISTP